MDNQAKATPRPMDKIDREHKALWTPRVRFNSGYHDGTQAEEQNWTPKLSHFDKWYFEGYKLGRRDFHEMGFRQETSDKAWQEFNSIQQASK